MDRFGGTSFEDGIPNSSIYLFAFKEICKKIWLQGKNINSRIGGVVLVAHANYDELVGYKETTESKTGSFQLMGATPHIDCVVFPINTCDFIGIRFY